MFTNIDIVLHDTFDIFFHKFEIQEDNYDEIQSSIPQIVNIEFKLEKESNKIVS